VPFPVHKFRVSAAILAGNAEKARVERETRELERALALKQANAVGLFARSARRMPGDTFSGLPALAAA